MKRIYRRKLKTNAFGQEVNHSGQTIVASQDTFYVEANRMFLKAQRDLKEGKANLLYNIILTCCRIELCV